MYAFIYKRYKVYCKMLLTIYLLLCLHFLESTPKSLPSYIEKCRKSDPNLNECLERSTIDAARKMKDGNKELGVAPLEPFFIEKVDLGNVVSGGTSLHQVYDNMNIFGMTNSTMYDSEANLVDNCYWKYRSKTPFVHIESDYIMKGQLLLFPINGHGKCAIDLHGIDGSYEAICERYTKKNQTHLRLKDFKFNMGLKNIVVDFENVIEGNEQLSKEVVKTLNENSEVLIADIVPSFNEVLGIIWKQAINRVFSRVPENELFLP